MVQKHVCHAMNFVWLFQINQYKVLEKKKTTADYQRKRGLKNTGLGTNAGEMSV